jgi:hypothetical protein
MSNFELLTDPTKLIIHDVDLTAATQLLVDPENANPIYIGETISLDGTASTEVYQRTLTAGATAVSYFCWAETGRFDVQGLKKLPLIIGGEFLADTKIFTAGTIAVGDPLQAGDATVDSQTKSGLIEHSAGADTDIVLAFATRLPANNNNYLRIHRVSPFRTA